MATSVNYDTTLMKGGLDQTTPTLSLPAGVLRNAINFECAVSGGYARVAGYERFDGRPSPSLASYTTLLVSVSGTISVGNTIVGVTSTATGVVAYIDGDKIVITKTSLTFTDGETLNIGGSPVGVLTSYTIPATGKDAAVYRASAADIYRADIAAPTGSGPCRGGFTLNSVTYVFRNNVGATGADLWRATSGGWVQVVYPSEISFTAGAVLTPADNETLTQGGVTATVKRVMTQTGAWTGTATGRFIITAIVGGPFIAGAASLSGGATCTLSGAETLVTMLPGGKIQTDVGNFIGRTSTSRIYGCDGINRGFEFDGATFCPISTGTGTDTPKFVQVHRNHLIWGILSSIIFSAPGLPYNYTALSFAGELSVGDEITGLSVQPGAQTTGTMAIFTANATKMLYGTGSSTWNLVDYNTGSGGTAYSVQNMAQTFFFNSFGITTLQTTLNFGNFLQASLTANLAPFISAQRQLVTCSVLCRSKEQYRVYFSNGYGLQMTSVNGQPQGVIPVLYPITDGTNLGFYNAFGSILSSSDEVIFGCGYDGKLYQMEKGTSFDGENVPSYIEFNWNTIRTPRVLKRFRKASIEMSGTSYAEYLVMYKLGYNSVSYAQPDSTLYSSAFNPSFWDNGDWDSPLQWDGTNTFPTDIDMTGTAENVTLNIASSNNYSGQFTVNSMILHYTMRRGLR